MGGRDPEVNGQVRNVFYLIFAAVTAAMLLALFGGLARNLTPAVRARILRKASNAPLFRQARENGLTYEVALSSPLASLGKQVLWCVSKQESGPALYGGSRDKPVDIINPEAMPSEIFRQHRRPCAEALLEITSYKTFDYEGARAVRIEARYLDYRL
jgi:hypothetical protein